MLPHQLSSDANACTAILWASDWAYLFLRSVHLDEEVDDAKVLQGLPVADVLQLGILDTEIQHGRMRLKHLAYNLGGGGEGRIGERREGRGERGDGRGERGEGRGEGGGGRGEGGGGRGEWRGGRGEGRGESKAMQHSYLLGFLLFQQTRSNQILGL